MIQVECAKCFKSFMKYPSQIKYNKFGNFCDRHCLGAYRSEHLTGSLGANFKRGSTTDRKYIRVIAPWHKYQANDNTVSLHRVIMEAIIGRYLESDEIVHHIDGNPENNHWSNLELMKQSAHIKLHKKQGDL